MEYQKQIKNSVQNLENYITENHFLGYDPYDFLKSFIFRLPFLKSNKIIRFIFQQFGKRFPLI